MGTTVLPHPAHSLLRYYLLFNVISKRTKNHFFNIEKMYKNKMLVLQFVDNKFYDKCTMLTVN